jgi:thiamine transport system substrate-binding protein
LFPEFERRCKCTVDIQSAGDAGQIVARLALDKSRKRKLPHILLGIDQNLFRSVQSDAIEMFEMPDPIAPQARVDPRFVPFDFGYFSFIADLSAMAGRKLALPQSYADLLRPELKSQFILQDPRTSSPGLGFLQSIQGAFGKASLQFLTKLSGQWLTMPSGWDEAYGLFLRGEAPLVWSYTTSQAYHDSSNESKGRYKAIMFKEGQGVQIEGAIAVKPAMSSIHEQKLTKMFLDLLLSPEIQKEIPRRQWMYPARSDVELPLEFKGLPAPTKILNLSDFESELALKQWSEAVLK